MLPPRENAYNLGVWPSASEATALRRYTNQIIIIIITMKVTKLQI